MATPPTAHRPRPTGVAVEAVTKRYGALAAVDGVSLAVEAGSFFSLLGPSGCGKTTLLRLVAGFETLDAGRVRIGGADMARLPPPRRPTAMVFQSYALFPTMTVGENVAYGLRVRKEKRAAVREKVARALARVDLAGAEERPVGQLSGGQQQRVALARALAVEPAVLLFDEPLSNLDAELREATRAELKTLQRELGTTSLYVTHDQTEALALSDRLALLRAGRVEAVGTPEALYDAPETAFTARFLGGANVIEETALAAALAGAPPPDGHVLAVRPDALVPVEDEASGVPVRVVARQFLGPVAEWTLAAEAPGGGPPVRLRMWTRPARPVPDGLRVRAERPRWVRADPPPRPAP